MVFCGDLFQKMGTRLGYSVKSEERVGFQLGGRRNAENLALEEERVITTSKRKGENE